jgi:hypothetical protein
MKMISVTKQNWKELNSIKKQQHMKNYNQAIEFLLFCRDELDKLGYSVITQRETELEQEREEANHERTSCKTLAL